MFCTACSYSKKRLTMGYLGFECSFRVGSTIKSTSTCASRCLYEVGDCLFFMVVSG